MHNISKDQNPLISVIMPVYNCAPYVEKSINSILYQSYGNFELIIIDDCSQDATLNMVESFDDLRIKVVKKQFNKGLVHSLNLGIQMAKGSLIARMDGDDYSLPKRFERQIRFLQKNKSIDICAVNVRIMDSNYIYNYPLTKEEVKVKLLFGTSITHAALMGWKHVFLKFPFDENATYVEDYDLWTRMAPEVNMVNMKEVLYEYRIHKQRTSTIHRFKQMDAARLPQKRMFDVLSYDQDRYGGDIFDKALLYNQDIVYEDLDHAFSFYEELLQRNKEIKFYDQKLFKIEMQRLRGKFFKNYISYSNDNYLKKIKGSVNFGIKDPVNLSKIALKILLKRK